MTEPKLITVSEVAAHLGINENAVWLFSQTGAIPKPVERDGSVRWHRSEIEAQQKTS